MPVSWMNIRLESPDFYMENSMEYRIRLAAKQPVKPAGAALTGFSVQGRILLPIQKTQQQAEDSKQAAKVRSSLLEAAKHGDEDAIETLTIEDIDMYSMVSRRIVHEDVYSIIETCFMPAGWNATSIRLLVRSQALRSKPTGSQVRRSTNCAWTATI